MELDSNITDYLLLLMKTCRGHILKDREGNKYRQLNEIDLEIQLVGKKEWSIIDDDPEKGPYKCDESCKIKESDLYDKSFKVEIGF